MKVYPKQNYVHIQPFEEEKKGAIEVPKAYRKKLNVGTVVSVHPDEKTVAVGDRVYYRKRPLAPLDDGSDTIVIPVEHVLMKEHE